MIVQVIGFNKLIVKLVFVGLSNSRSLRTRISGHCEPVRFPGVAISWIGVQFLVDEFQKTVQRTVCMTIGRLEFDGDSHESSAHWLGMTCSDDALNYNLLHYRTTPSGLGQKRLHQSTARLGRPPCGQIPDLSGNRGL